MRELCFVFSMLMPGIFGLLAASISVSDRGPGVPPEDRERIFSSFFRSSTHRGMASGLGLGLTVSKRLVELQGGAISVKDRPEGGSTFVVTLPRAPLVDAPAPSRTAAS